MISNRHFYKFYENLVNSLSFQYFIHAGSLCVSTIISIVSSSLILTIQAYNYAITVIECLNFGLEWILDPRRKNWKYFLNLKLEAKGPVQ
jgi:hypothetical protein